VPQVVFLKGINVGGHRTLRPTALARELRHLDVVSVGAAGTFVVRERIGRARLRSEILRRLPFTAKVVMCAGSEVVELASADPFAGRPAGRDIVHFVSVMARRPRRPSTLPPALPPTGRWGLKILEWRGQFVLGLYRREMKAIGYLGQLEKLVGTPLATRSWSTILAVVNVLQAHEE
jgi:hypothetical protein